MKKPKRPELVKSIIQRVGLTQGKGKSEYLSREQLLELHSFLSVNASKLAAIRHIIDGIGSVCENYIVSIPNVCVAVKKWVGEAKGILNNQHDRKRVIDNGESAESPSR